MAGVDKSELARRLAHFRSVARAAGVKLTHQRLEIFAVVAASVEHPSAEAVHRGLRERMPTLSLDTVYRTLWLLADLGLVATLGPKRESLRFDANLERHHHYICVRCGLVRDFTNEALHEVPIPQAVQAFGSIDGAHLEVRGVCSRCGRRAGKSGRRQGASRYNRSKR